MAFDLEGRGLSPLSDLLELSEFPLVEFIPDDVLSSVFDALSYTDGGIYQDGDNLVIDVQVVFEQELALRIPGSDAFALVFGSAGPGFTSLRTEIVLGPDFSMSLVDAPVSLRVSPDILRNVTTDGPAEITITGDLRFSGAGLTLENVSGASLAPAYLCGTKIVVEADDVVPVFGPIDVPEFLAEQGDFQGLAIKLLRVTIPPEYLETDPGAALAIELSNAAIGTTGFTGAVQVSSADVGYPVTGRFLGFPFRFREFHLAVVQNALIDARLGVDLRLEKLENDDREKWVAVDLSFSSDGGFSGALAAVQPTEAEGTPEWLVVAEFESVMQLRIQTLRLTVAEGLWALYFSGELKLLIPGTSDWPAVAFDELGVRSDGEILLPEGGGIALATPLVTSWYFARLTVTKFRFGHADVDQSKLQVALTAQVELLKGVPAGASVEGLVIEWEPGSGATPTIRFTGIKVDVSVPGSFIAHAEVDYVTSAEGVQFRGRGAIELSALDVAMDVAVVIGEHRPPPPGESFTFLYLFVDAELLPTGIPIASTGLSIYGFQGLLAYNMALDLNTSLPVDERYYELFMRAPTGITQNEKWKPAPGRNALGAGLIVGSADKGFALNAKGMLVIELPDLTILLHARVNFLKKKPDLTTSQQGALEALMVYAAGDRALTLDITAQWGMPHVVSVEGHARAFFDFDNPGAWYLEIGRDEDNKRVLAKALEWNGNWLFSAGFWFRVDLHGVVTGVLIEVSMRKSRGGFWVEAKGSARGEMALFWEPTQWEGSLTLAGRIAAGYRGLSVGVSLSGQARARVYRPFDVHVRVEACVEALFWEVCKTFDFDWIRDEPPLLEVPFRRLAAKPRHWTIERDAGPPERVDTGVVALWPEGGVLAIQPHSVLSLDFTKPILDATTVFNEAVPLPDGGFMTVGERSGWAAAFRLDAVTLTRDPDGVAEDLTVFGTWARETLQPNTTLRLQASHRFGDDGSLSGGYLEGTELDYCAQPTDSRTCISLESMRPGFGWLDEGAIYWWAEQIQIRLRGRYAVVEVTLECPDEYGGAKLVTLPIKTTGGGHLVVITEQFGKCRPKELCLQTGHGQWDWHELSVIGGLSTGVEEWTVPAEMRLLPPGQLFELGVQYTALLKHPDGSVTEPLGSGTVITKRFRTTGPPARANALDAYVVSVNPFAGSRPVYTAYDLSLQLVDEYVRYLYSMAGEQLVFRLFDGQGNPIRDGDDHELHIPVIDLAQSPQLIGDLVWQEIVVAGIDAGCVTFPERPKESGTVLRLPLEARDITLTPNSQYAAWLVSDARPDVPLYAWGFTTSWFGTFSLLASTNRVVRPTRLLAAPPAAQDFDALARATDVATVGYVDRFTITPCADDVGVHALVIESPEPMAFGTRLTVTVDGTSTTAHANADGTRAFVLPATGPWPIGTRSVLLRWLRDAGSAVPRVTVDGNSADEIIVVEVVVEAVS